MDWYLTSALSWLPVLLMLMFAIIAYVMFLVFDFWNDAQGEDTNKTVKQSSIGYVFHVIVPSVLITTAICWYVCGMVLSEQNKVLKEAPIIKINNIVEEESPDHSTSDRYLYYIADSKNNVYKLATDKKVDFKKYTLKMPYDETFGNYIYLFQDNKYVADYYIISASHKK